MDHSTTFLNTDEATQSIWPWVMGLIALGSMAILMAQTLKVIPASIAVDVHQAIKAQNLSGINLEVDGRDVALSGTVDINVDKRQLVASIKEVNGVRSVSDSLKVFDPQAAARERALDFQAELSTINFSALAFEPNSASLTADSRPALESLTRLLLQYPEQRVRVSGHTDNTGRPAVNLRISRERASTVASYINSRGVTDAQVIARGFGASRPIADNSTEAGRARNRRIEITYIK